MSLADYADAPFSMHGIPEGCYRDVPLAAQERVVRSFPDLRLLWNPVIAQYQCVQQDQSRMQPMWGLDGHCVLDGWVIINGNYDRSLGFEEIVQRLLLRQWIALEAYQRDGGIDALAERLAAEEVRRQEAETHAKFVEATGVDSWTGQVHRVRPGWSRKDGVAGFDRPSRLPVMDARYDAVAQPAVKGPGAKELARRARKMDAALRTGSPL